MEGLRAEVGEPLGPLGELTGAEGQRLLGLGGEALRQAQRRCCSVPCVPPSAEGRRRLESLVQRRGLTVVQGNRMGHLLGPDISKGNALATLKRHLGAEQLKVLAWGDSPNDLPLLEVADIAVVVPGADGPHPALRSGIAAGLFQLAAAPHANGWDEAVRRILRI